MSHEHGKTNIMIVNIVATGSFKSTFVVKGRGSSVSLLSEKYCLIFQTANKVLSDKLLSSCSMFCCFEPSPVYKSGFFIKKAYIYFFNLTFFYELVNIYIVIVYIAVLKSLIFYAQFTKNRLFSLFSLLDSSFENS